jgi:uncharacterized protein YyaL (SSP411 family)
MRRLVFGLPLLLVACANASLPAHAPALAAPTQTTAAPANDEPQAAPKEELPWATFSPETFAKAKAEHKFIVLDGSAEWCHWCHVMEATTYHDPAVRAVLDKNFISVKVDIDSRPDLAERYGDYGWPATILFSPDASEIGKYRGYINPEKFVGILNEVVSTGGSSEAVAGFVIGASRPAPKTPLPEEQLLWIEHNTDLDLAEYWDADEGGWGKQQKASLGWDNAWLLWKAEHGSAPAKTQATFALEKQSALLDPVWGGIYQYSAARDWNHPHFEKLMTFQAAALDNYATAYRITNDSKMLARAQSMLGYIDRFLKGADGGFYTTQDADLNAHDRSKAFMDGHQYYALNDAQRTAKGIPRVDTNEYGRENGLAIAAYASMYEATKDPAVLASAVKAANHILATHKATPLVGLGGITHGPATEDEKQAFLSDNAAFGFGLARLYEVTHDEHWRKEAQTIANFVLTLQDDEGGGLFGATKDPNAVGVFAKRRIPFEDNVMALRLLARVSAPKLAIDRILRAISVSEEIKGRGRWLGDYLLALEETKPVR